MTDRYLDRQMGIMLMDGEELLLEAKANEGFVWYAVVIALMTVVGIIVSPIVYLCAKVAQGKYRYWLTNRRVIISSGFIGFCVCSDPFERVSDVAFSNTLPELLANIQSAPDLNLTGVTSTA